MIAPILCDWLCVCHSMYVRVCEFVSVYGYQVVCASVCICVCIGCFLFIAGVVHVKAHTVEESRCKYVCMCVCVHFESHWTVLYHHQIEQKKNEKQKHKRKKLKAKSTLAIQVDQNVTRGWRMVVAPTGPIKLRQQTYTHTHTWVTLLMIVCINIAIHRRRCQSIGRSIDWSVSERTNVKFIRYTLHETCQLKCENSKQLTQNDAATRKTKQFQ